MYAQAPADVWPLRVPLILHTCTLARSGGRTLTHVCDFPAVAGSSSGVARRNPIPAARRWGRRVGARAPTGSEGSQGVHRNPRLAASGGRIWLVRGKASGDLSSPQWRRRLRLPLWRLALPPGCVPPRHLQLRPTPSGRHECRPAAATVAKVRAESNPVSGKGAGRCRPVPARALAAALCTNRTHMSAWMPTKYPDARDAPVELRAIPLSN